MNRPSPASQSRQHAPAVGSPSGPVAPGDDATTQPNLVRAMPRDAGCVPPLIPIEAATAEPDSRGGRGALSSAREREANTGSQECGGNLASPDILPFPVADTPGRPYIRLHRPIDALDIAEAVGDKEMIAAIRDRLGKPVHIGLGRSPLLDLACYGVIAVAMVYFGVQLLRWFL